MVFQYCIIQVRRSVRQAKQKKAKDGNEGKLEF